MQYDITLPVLIGVSIDGVLRFDSSLRHRELKARGHKELRLCPWKFQITHVPSEVGNFDVCCMPVLAVRDDAESYHVLLFFLAGQTEIKQIEERCK